MKLLILSMLLLLPFSAHAATITVTSYNPERQQTDDSPCTGASGRDLCRATREGDRVIALSRDLLSHYRWHDKVRLVSPIPQCNGVFSVEDTLNKRFRERADLFFLSRSQNTSCVATIQKVN